MKKVLALVLALVLVLSLVACGGGDKKENTGTIPAEISLNDTITANDYEFSITKTEFLNDWSPIFGQPIEHYSDGSVFFVVHSTLKNVGKTERLEPFDFMTLEYGDGYTFHPVKICYYDTSLNSFVGYITVLPVLSDATPYLTGFEVPEQVKTGNDPLTINVSIYGEEYTYKVR